MALFELGIGPGFCGEKKYFLAISSLGLSREQGGVRYKVGTECSEIEQLEAQARQIIMNIDSVLAQARIQFTQGK